jgi:probable rRNA maturation factor
VSIALVTDREIRKLNRAFRRVDKPTDVLSFPAATLKGSAYIGDLAIARGVARRQARAAGHSEAIEWRVLALHGLLHLLGYDHEHDDGRMQRVERKLRRKGGLREGLIDRSR